VRSTSTSSLVLLKDVLEAKFDLVHVPITLPLALRTETFVTLFASFALLFHAFTALNLLLLLALLLVHDEHACGALLETGAFRDSRIPHAGRGDGRVCRLCLSRTFGLWHGR